MSGRPPVAAHPASDAGIRSPAIPAAFSPIPVEGGVRFSLRGAKGWSRLVLAGFTLGAGGLGFALLDASPGAAALLLAVGVGLAGLTGWRWSRAATPLAVTAASGTIGWEGNDGPVALPLSGLERVEALGVKAPTLLLRVGGVVVELDAGGHAQADVVALAEALAAWKVQ